MYVNYQGFGRVSPSLEQILVESKQLSGVRQTVESFLVNQEIKQKSNPKGNQL